MCILTIDILKRLADVLNIDIKDLFEISHKAPTQKELKETLNSLLKDADEEKLRMAIKVLRAVVR